jgi:uncharacterized protein
MRGGMVHVTDHFHRFASRSMSGFQRTNNGHLYEFLMSSIEARKMVARAAAVIAICGCAQASRGIAAEPVLVKQPSCERAAGTDFELTGVEAGYLRGITQQWLLVAPDANPAMLEMFRDRDRLPRRAMQPWAGEFAGKYLTGAVQVYRVTHDKALKAYLSAFVKELCSLQAEDGYLGPWPKASRLTGTAPNIDQGTPGQTWDAWGHYHVMVGLVTWWAEMGDEQALQCAARIGDLLCQKFLGDQKPRLVDTGSTEMNLAPVHALCLLYRARPESRYLQLAKQIADEFAARDNAGKPLAGDYINAAKSLEFFQSPKPRWESLHSILGLVELYYLTGDDRYRQAFEHWWWSIVKLDRHNNGGFSSGEQAQGNPYHQGAIETCCTIAWMTMTTEMLKLSGNSVVADELELSTLNSALGMLSPTGRWATYNTPMEGVRRASAHDIVFQSREGSPELNCCSVNSARGLGLLSEWAVMRDSKGLLLNWFGPGKITAPLADGTVIPLQLTTDYPRDGHVEIKVSPTKETRFSLRLRIPYWSANTLVKLNGEAVKGIKPGNYLVLDRVWKVGDTIELNFDFTLHYWSGERESEGKVSIYRGPILLTYDRRFNEMDPADVPSLDAGGLEGKSVTWPGRHAPILLLELTADGGRVLRLCDFASAGDGGTPYLTWLRVKHVAPTSFSPGNPLRSGRALTAQNK